MVNFMKNRVSLVLVAALVLGSLTLLGVSTSQAQTAATSPAMTQTSPPSIPATPAPAGVPAQPGVYGPGYGCPWMYGYGYAPTAYRGSQRARYYGPRSGYYGHGMMGGWGCW